jgi:hypothetical protein
MVAWESSLSILADAGLADRLISSTFTSSEDWEVDSASCDVNWVIMAEVVTVDWASFNVDWVIMVAGACLVVGGLRSSSSVSVSSAAPANCGPVYQNPKKALKLLKPKNSNSNLCYTSLTKCCEYHNDIPNPTLARIVLKREVVVTKSTTNPPKDPNTTMSSVFGIREIPQPLCLYY